MERQVKHLQSESLDNGTAGLHLRALIECLFDVDPVRMRAADGLEKVSRVQTRDIEPYASVLLDLFAQTDQQELQWHLAALIPRLHLSHFLRLRTAEIVQNCFVYSAKRSRLLPECFRLFVDLQHEEVNESAGSAAHPDFTPNQHNTFVLKTGHWALWYGPWRSTKRMMRSRLRLFLLDRTREFSA